MAAARTLLAVNNVHVAVLAHRVVKPANLGLLEESDFRSIVCINFGTVHSLRACALLCRALSQTEGGATLV